MQETALAVPVPATQASLKKQLVEDVMSALRAQETTILTRNTEINKRYNALYGAGLTDGLAKPKDFDDTELNYVKLVPDIMTNQLFGRGFTVKTSYNQEDLSTYDLPTAETATATSNKVERDQARILNGHRRNDASIRDNAIKGIFEDNGGLALWNRAGKMQSYAGFVGIQHYWDGEEKQYRIIPLENPNNIWVCWASSDFRKYDAIGYVDEISELAAYRNYKDYLGEGDSFKVAKPDGMPWQYADAQKLNDLPVKMVTRISISGYLPGWQATGSGKDVELKKSDKMGDETEVGLTIIGGHLCHVRTQNIPRYELINNNEDPLKPYGVSDVPDSAISINRTLIQVARAWFTLGFKSAFYKIIAKGFTSVNIPQSTPFTTEFLPTDTDQDFKLLEQPQGFPQLQAQTEFLIEQFTRITRIGQVMFNDPSAVSNSNQAMLTGMKPLIDVVEEKQGRWNNAIKNIIKNALTEIAAAGIDKGLTDAINSDPTWEPIVQWPSVFRKEDNAYQTMWANQFNMGTLSVETLLEKIGPDDVSEEIDRLRTESEDPLLIAILSKQLALLAQQKLMPPPPAAPPAAPGLPADSSVPSNPIAAPDQNTEGTQPVSVAGSGAPPVSPQGALDMTTQRLGG